MSVVAVQSAPVAFHPTFQHNRHSAAPPAALLTPAKSRTPGIITLSKPLNAQRQSPRQRKATPSAAPAVSSASPKSEKSRKPRSRPTSDEEEHDTPSKPRGRRQNAEKQSPNASPAAAPKRRNPSRARQTPSPESDPTPQLQKPSGRLAKHRRGFTKSTPALCSAVNAAGSAPVPVPQLSSSASHPTGLSRSVPLATPPMSQSIPARMRRTLTGNGREEQPKDMPPSPSPRRVRESKGPLTAPLTSGFPARPPHARSPSEALFNLSLDDTEDEPQDMPVLFRNRGGDKVYAGGRFQNGPDPTMLPAPSFLTGF
ncbi:hypothetical protein BN14_00989 [Rhizoctonia solani AG-1 IB]|uniref:Uncharacterized protein n=1 Tax=Thanatephorus cucumeris (strain AG1-IB / isolate 7/3/14) TaxID=1108050 RepID=M5BJU7_THACB|nr:hypothetical protein BN14_00989 [Rhizoctonia solani AG-1 IB]